MIFNSPFNYYCRNFDFNHTVKYFGGTVTLPANKYIKGKQYKDYLDIEQIEILKNLLKDLKLDSIHYSFEHHPNRKDKNMHMHFLFKSEMQDDLLIETIYHNLFTLTKSTIIHKICKFERLYQEYNVINWLNYMYEEYKDHWFLLTNIMENTLLNSISVYKTFIY